MTLPDWRHSQCIGPIFRVVRKPRIGRGSDAAGGEVGEQRVLARPAVAVTGVALRLAAKQVVAHLLLRRDFTLPASTASNFELNGVTSAEAS